jgi:hypothetical protein
MSIVESTNIRFNVNTKDNCGICLEPLSDERESLVRAACAHIFHENCFMQWRMTPKEGDYALQEKNCSLCRGPLDTAQFIKTSSVDGATATYNVVPGAIPSVPWQGEDMRYRNNLRRRIAMLRGDIQRLNERTNPRLIAARQRILPENQENPGFDRASGIFIGVAVTTLALFGIFFLRRRS